MQKLPFRTTFLLFLSSMLTPTSPALSSSSPSLHAFQHPVPPSPPPLPSLIIPLVRSNLLLDPIQLFLHTGHPFFLHHHLGHRLFHFNLRLLKCLVQFCAAPSNSQAQQHARILWRRGGREEGFDLWRKVPQHQFLHGSPHHRPQNPSSTSTASRAFSRRIPPPPPHALWRRSYQPPPQESPRLHLQPRPPQVWAEGPQASHPRGHSTLVHASLALPTTLATLTDVATPEYQGAPHTCSKCSCPPATGHEARGARPFLRDRDAAPPPKPPPFTLP